MNHISLWLTHKLAWESWTLVSFSVIAATQLQGSGIIKYTSGNV